MDGRFNSNPFVSEQEEQENSPENSGDSTPSPMFNDTKISSSSSTPSPKRSRRAMQKRVVSVPIKDVESSRLKGEFAPPSDSWAWRKYGQKPIKGSPYPRGYYRCSSSKGCPARKQVERCRADPTMLVVTYSCEHNHPWPASRNHHNTTAPPAAAAPPTPVTAPATPPSPSPSPSPKPDIFSSTQAEPDQDEKFADLGQDFTWFSEFESPSSTILESPIFAENNVRDADVAMFFPMREEDESLFADLGELPECALVFRRGVLEMEEERRRCTAPMCGTTS